MAQPLVFALTGFAWQASLIVFFTGTFHELRMYSDEILDIVDTNDSIIGQQARSLIYEQKSKNFRVINAFIKNSQGLLWIPRRSASKKLFPLCLDVSVGGHVKSGETYLEAFKRELAEEANLLLNNVNFKHLGTLNPYEHNISAFMHVYEIATDATPQYNQDDFIEYYWLSPGELVKRLQNTDKGKDDLDKLIRHFYL